ncbi:MAG: NTP transferase domain-containing protein [Woeseiaceae bacterium]|nr:NTP transferase domain-containing protein [Woeseiaceae bacterium]
MLAGGESRRMGSDKALLSRGGETQLGHAYRLLAGCTEQAWISTRESQAAGAERARYPQIVDRYAGLGPLAGILSAMDQAPDAAWLVLACDLPNVDEATLRALLAGRAPAQPFTAFRSSHDDLPEPLCAIYEPGSRALLDGFIADGVNCPRKIMIRSATALLRQPDPAALDNVNTPQDLEENAARVSLEVAS